MLHNFCTTDPTILKMRKMNHNKLTYAGKLENLHCIEVLVMILVVIVKHFSAFLRIVNEAIQTALCLTSYEFSNSWHLIFESVKQTKNCMLNLKTISSIDLGMSIIQGKV